MCALLLAACVCVAKVTATSNQPTKRAIERPMYVATDTHTHMLNNGTRCVVNLISRVKLSTQPCLMWMGNDLLRMPDIYFFFNTSVHTYTHIHGICISVYMQCSATSKLTLAYFPITTHSCIRTRFEV